MARMFACAGLGIFLTLAASILAIFAHIGQINGNLVPRNIRMVSVTTGGLGQASGVGTGLYGQGARDASTTGTGLRQYYEWGLWNYCEKDTKGGSPDYCSGTSWANEFRPTEPILFDTPSADQSQLASALPAGVFSSADYLGRYSKAAFYLLFIGAVLGGLAFITGFLAHRFAFLIAALLTALAFLCEAVGAIIWTVIIHRAKNSTNGTGVAVSYGDGLWIYWASVGCLLFATLPYLLACIIGRDRY